MGDIYGNYGDNSISATTVPGTETTSVGGEYSADGARTVKEILDGREVPQAMESTAADLPKGQIEQVDLNENTSIANDRDGDGIPDGYDKHPDRSTADVAAEKYGIGKYAKAKNAGEIFSTKSIMAGGKAVNKAVDGVAASAAASLTRVGEKKETSALDSKSDGDSFGPKKLGSMEQDV